MSNVRYTKLPTGHWIIESKERLTITLIQQQKRFTDHDGKEHQVVEFVVPSGAPESPYLNFTEAVTAD